MVVLAWMFGSPGGAGASKVFLQEFSTNTAAAITHTVLNHIIVFLICIFLFFIIGQIYFLETKYHACIIINTVSIIYFGRELIDIPLFKIEAKLLIAACNDVLVI